VSRSVFNPTGTLNVSWDASDLPGESTETAEVSGHMTRCKNMRINQNGKLVVRDGSTKINSVAIDTTVWLLEEMATLGTRYTFAGDEIYEDESSLITGMADAQWSAMQYNSYNDTTKQILALNGTDRKRVTAGAVNEWGIAAPTVAPTLSPGQGSGLTGQYNAVYTYVRKVSDAIVAESNPSPVSTDPAILNDQSLSAKATDPTDSQVTHIRLYRTLAGGVIYYLDQEIELDAFDYGYGFDWELTDAYISGTGFKFTVADSVHASENTYTWEELFDDREDEDDTTYGDRDLWPRPWDDLDEYRRDHIDREPPY